MCLLVVAWRAHPCTARVVAESRMSCGSAPERADGALAGWPPILARSRPQTGGTWIGIDACHRFGLVTNFRELAQPAAPRRPRPPGAGLPRRRPTEVARHTSTQLADAQGYAGFNLLLGDGEQLFYARRTAPTRFARPLEPGLHGLSNHLLDTPWPQAAPRPRRARALLARRRCRRPGLESANRRCGFLGVRRPGSATALGPRLPACRRAGERTLSGAVRPEPAIRARAARPCCCSATTAAH